MSMTIDKGAGSGRREARVEAPWTSWFVFIIFSTVHVSTRLYNVSYHTTLHHTTLHRTTSTLHIAHQRLCCDGFGAFTGAGVAYFEAFMCALQTSKWADVRYVRMRPPGGLERFVGWGLANSGDPSGVVNRAGKAGLIHVRGYCPGGEWEG